MKNNLILIFVVTVISIAIIIISVVVSLGGKGGEESQDSSSTTSAVSQTEPTEPEPEPTSEPDTPVSVPETETTADSEEEVLPEAEDIIALARSLIGTDFADGGETPAFGFDNSGFIYYVLRENGYITCPRGVSAQSQMGTVRQYDELSPGDLVFFSESGANAEFGGIYTGNGVMIACLMPGTKVREVDITTDYYSRNFFCGVAII